MYERWRDTADSKRVPAAYDEYVQRDSLEVSDFSIILDAEIQFHSIARHQIEANPDSTWSQPLEESADSGMLKIQKEIQDKTQLSYLPTQVSRGLSLAGSEWALESITIMVLQSHK